MKRYLLFDLDGTLSNTGPGIMASARYALSALGFPEQSEESLRRMVGPPLDIGWREFFGLEGEQNLLAIEKFREYYREHGVFKSELYPGVKELLEKLHGRATLCIATSKPEFFANKILEMRGIAPLFSVLVGSPMGAEGTTKPEIIQKVLAALGDPPHEEVVMIGDRFYDIEGAKACGVASIGVKYGFSAHDELKEAGADHVVDTVEELGRLLEDLL